MNFKKYSLTFPILLLTWTLIAQRSEVSGGPAPLLNTTKCLSNEHRELIHYKLQLNLNRLRSEGKIPTSQDRSAVLFQFPMDWNTGFEDYGFYGISNFVDHNAEYPGFITDYNCGTRSYDTEDGYNHLGIDYFLWPFAWNLVEEKAVKVVAAAPGMIIGRDDGHEHFNCGFSSAMWNAIYLRHDDGSFSWYGHMQKNSLTTKAVGETVEAGEYLGLVGSSGNSTAPHLHFEVYDSNGLIIDPNAGECNDLNEDTWWVEQSPYFDPAVNKIQTHSAPPDFNVCPELEDIYASDDFIPGELIYFVTYFKDQQSTDLCQFSIIQPDDQVYDQWTFFQPQTYFAASYWYWSYVIPDDAIEGTWVFKCEFAGKTYTHDFFINNDVSGLKGDNKFLNSFKAYRESNQVILEANTTISFDGVITLTDGIGRVILTHSQTFSAGLNRIPISSYELSAGIYNITISTGSNGFLGTRRIFLN